jgi:hypothetical protein
VTEEEEVISYALNVLCIDGKEDDIDFVRFEIFQAGTMKNVAFRYLKITVHTSQETYHSYRAQSVNAM